MFATCEWKTIDNLVYAIIGLHPVFLITAKERVVVPISELANSLSFLGAEKNRVNICLSSDCLKIL